MALKKPNDPTNENETPKEAPAPEGGVKEYKLDDDDEENGEEE